MNKSSLDKEILIKIIEKSKTIRIDAIKILPVDKIIDFYKSNDLNYDFLVNEIKPKYKTVITSALSYNYLWNNVDSNEKGYISHYTTANYYKILFKKLKELALYIKEIQGIKSSNNDFFKIYVNSKINDKIFAAISGLGYYSKNSLINVVDIGQKCVLGELFIDLDIDDNHSAYQIDLKINSRCNNCTRCFTVCPTDALKSGLTIDKDKCLQHLSGKLDMTVKIEKKEIMKLWGKRFFGCTDCIDICPENKNTVNYDNPELIGYIGTSYDLNKILNLKKDDYKEEFKNNQLSSSWIDPLCLARNALIALYNCGDTEKVKSYILNLDKFMWNETEQKYLLNFFDFL
jgi:epoxyqueuosine reductase